MNTHLNLIIELLEKIEKNTRKKAPVKSGVSGAETWSVYSNSYFVRYQSEAPSNARNNSLCLQLVKLVGEQEAPYVANYYVRHNDAFYVQAMHPLNLLVRDAQKLHTEWKTGTQMTGTKARGIERQQNNLNAFKGLVHDEDGHNQITTGDGRDIQQTD